MNNFYPPVPTLAPAATPPAAFKPILKPLLFSLLITSTLLGGCQDEPAINDESATGSVAAVDTSVSVDDTQTINEANNATLAASTTEQITIDWGKVDSGVKKVDPDTFNYPFAIDSAPVKAYMDYFKVDARTAQYNLTVSMASNEALSKVLDQVGEQYVAHQVTDGDDIKLVIHTTKAVMPSQYDYVLAGYFAKGLTLPIQIITGDKKNQPKSHAVDSHTHRSDIKVGS